MRLYGNEDSRLFECNAVSIGKLALLSSQHGVKARKSETSAPLWNLSYQHTEVIRGAHFAQQDKDRRMLKE
jgi:hypothetical protein